MKGAWEGSHEAQVHLKDLANVWPIQAIRDLL
jgi:hypothetical protein